MITSWWWAALVVAAVSTGALALAADRLGRERRELRRVTARVRQVRYATARQGADEGITARRRPGPDPAAGPFGV